MARKTQTVKPQSAIEQTVEIASYNDLVYKINELGIKDSSAFGDGGKYVPAIGRSVWQTVILSTKPMETNSVEENELLVSIYGIIYAFTVAGEYPLMQQLCNYLGVGIDDFFSILGKQGHPLRKVYTWAYNVFEACAMMNAIRSNGNSNIRVWIDKSRENKISAETKVELALEASKIQQLTQQGEEINRLLMSEDIDEYEDGETEEDSEGFDETITIPY